MITHRRAWACLWVLVTFCALFFPSQARADPFAGTWYAVPESLTPVGGRETYSVTARTTAGVTTFDISFNCGAIRPCTRSGTSATLGRPDHFVVGNFVAPAPKRLFIFVHDPSCTTRYGAAAYLGVWSDTGAPPFIAQCFLTRMVTAPGGVGPVPVPAPRPLPSFRLPTIPPFVQRPGALPAPNPSPQLPQPLPPG